MKQLSDESRRRLIEYLGECWHEWKEYTPITMVGNNICSCGFRSWQSAVRNHINKLNRTFDTYEDLGALKDKLVENGEWEDFHYYATQICNRMFRPFEFSKWLFRPESCALVDEYLASKEA